MKLNKLMLTLGVSAGLLLAGVSTASANTDYTIQAGDSLWSISQTHGVTLNELIHANKSIADKNDLILPGDKIVIPAGHAFKNSMAVATAPTTPAQPVQQPTQTAPATQTQPASTSTGNGGTKSYVLNQMASRTGVPASTWNYIIQRESNWQPGVRNSSSGAYGLFQNMHISGGSVQQQVDAAVSLYNQQGMQAWALY
ncbi:LysM peptidoglycan-binding domain-containing protein [Secundilactobacillus kimchicus]|uniref:LysM peptidoglycan-binding domain-containing protein n=1 Tax=Secundilactobacillus kimchicus TaxID=528209 RepID=UPI001C01334F|nr:LysM peptidoglycan-binding domain-containing protein [Secundilactobacillus kimchicus]MBT9670594.1 LysM peptidoglycan-binding domain-containing protein [Secundilactobacillus kimchicus]